MEDNSILNIEKWKEIYPFLYDVWITYGLFNSSMDNSAYKGSYNSLCYQILYQMRVDVDKYKDVCMKLMRNLEYYNPLSKYFEPTPERCNILYNWIYNLIEEEKVTEDIIKKCFEEYNDYKNKISSDRRCDYFSHIEQFEKPMNIILLDIFRDNMEIIRNELTRDYDSTAIPLKKFLCESLKIYKHMNESYCSRRGERNGKHTNICTKLDNFKSTYSFFRTKLGKLNNITPELDDIDNGFFDQCSSDEQKSLLDTDKADAGKTLQEDMRTPPRNEDNSMKKTITTTVGTVAGASSLLALLYRFTPGRKWIHSGFGGRRGRISSNFYEGGTNELLFNGMEGEDFNSYNQRYDIGYSPM